MVIELLLVGDDWSRAVLVFYAVERVERMWWFWFVSTLMSALVNEFGFEVEWCWVVFRERLVDDLILGVGCFVVFVGFDVFLVAAFDLVELDWVLVV